MIESIQIRDFRGIQQGQIKGLRQLNLLVGPNNSGKSTLMEALYLAGTVGRSANLQARYEESISYDVTTAMVDLTGNHPQTRIWERHNHPGKQAALGRWSGGILYYTLRDPQIAFTNFDLATADNFAQGEEQTTALFAIDSKPPQKGGNAEKDKPEDTEVKDPHALLAQHLLGSDVDPFQNARLLFLWHPEFTHYLKGSAAWLVRGQMPSPAATFLFDAAAVQNHIPLTFYERMFGTIPGWTQQIGRHFGRIFNLTTPFTVQFLPAGANRQQMQGWIAPEDKPAIPIDAFGDGSRAAFKLITFLTALIAKATPDAPGLLLWEEPESFQHPKTLVRLLRTVAQMIRGKPVQIFMATHDLELLAYLAMLLQDAEIDPQDALVFRLDLQDGRLKSSWFDNDILLGWLKEGLDPRDWGDFMPLRQFRVREEVA